MAAITRFEEIDAWVLGRELANLIYTYSNKGAFARDFGLKDQMRRAAVSVISNIAEGFERDGNREFIQFLSHAKGSCGELRAQLYLAMDQRYISEDEFKAASELAIRTSKATYGFMDYLINHPFKGKKYNSEPDPEDVHKLFNE